MSPAATTGEPTTRSGKASATSQVTFPVVGSMLVSPWPVLEKIRAGGSPSGRISGRSG